MQKLLVLIDKLADAFPLMSRHWTTISARSWAAKLKGKAWGAIAVALIDRLFHPGHCREAWEGEQALRAP